MVTKLIICLVLFFSFLGCATSTPQTTASVEIGSQRFELELAIDLQSRTTGLMHRSVLANSGGMLFVFPDVAERSFWMKNCLMDIDLAFLDSRGFITAIHSMLVEPQKSPDESMWEYETRLKPYPSYGPARFAIELSSGSFKRLGIEIHDKITLDLPTLKNRAR